jgi:hypothetical protein
MINRIVTCGQCNTDHELSIRLEDWVAWREGALIQRAMPYLTDGQRELLISQTCGECFEAMFSEDDS